MRGIYIVANDKVKDNAIALLNSIRLYDPDVPVVMIPFNEQYQEVASILSEKHQVQLFPDLEFVEQFTQQIGEIFDRDFLNLPNKMRKLVQWFGPLEQFLYIDTDILVFEPMSQLLDYLNEYEFLCCDYHFKGRKLADVFAPDIGDRGIFSAAELSDVFNSGFWGSRQGIFSLEELYGLLRECAQHREYFDFSQNTTDQPILNYLILKSTEQRLNLVKASDCEPGSWAGSPHFREENRILYDGRQRLRYLHWAGTPMQPGGPYRDLWEYYRYLGEERPPQSPTVPARSPSWWQQALQKIKRLTS
ncbi:MAG: methionine synthase [Spirulinaceae cyanobacterium RM2_2_10]|nr:methionine synthase [Spirulinaceae cyanobacterium SM2_1_0]NJO19517.1 methionine synthase [Spirulinaceae cyanobacterium RM2_2_10]